MAPFRKMMEFPNGGLSTCCHYPKLKNKYDSLEEAFYGPEMENHRQQMMRGEYLEDCKICHLHEKSPGHEIFKSQRQQYNLEYDAEKYIIDKKTPEPIITDLELSVDTTCNYMCVICGPRASSAWEKRIGDDFGPTGFKIKESMEWPPRKFKNSLKKPSIHNIEKFLPNLKFLILTGGEPTIQKKLDEDFYAKLNQYSNDDLTFGMITNCSKFIGENAVKFIKKNKKVIIMPSLDGVGEVGEWCRYGLKMKIFHRNLLKWIDLVKDKTEQVVYENLSVKSGIVVNICVHNYNLFNMFETITYLNDLKLENSQYILSFNNSNSVHICPSYLPSNIKNYILENVDFFDKQHEEFYLYMLNMNEYDEKYCNKFLEYTDYLIKYAKPPDECLTIYKMLKNER